MACADGGGPDRENRGVLDTRLSRKGYRCEGKESDRSEYARLTGHFGGGGTKTTGGRGMDTEQGQPVTRGEN